MRKILAITPLQREYDALARALKCKSSVRSQPAGKIQAAFFQDFNLVVALGGHGKVQFVLHTEYLLERIPKVDLVVCAGVAGGLIEGLSAGDVVIATQTIEHDYKERFDKISPPTFQGDAEFLAWLEPSQKPFKDFAIHFGPIASGDEDIVSPDRAKELHNKTGAIAVAWEGAGAARACKFYDKPYAEIRGITDSANAHAPRDFLENSKRAMEI